MLLLVFALKVGRVRNLFFCIMTVFLFNKNYSTAPIKTLPTPKIFLVDSKVVTYRLLFLEFIFAHNSYLYYSFARSDRYKKASTISCHEMCVSQSISIL